MALGCSITPKAYGQVNLEELKSGNLEVRNTGRVEVKTDRLFF
jgi:hypothetical protein